MSFLDQLSARVNQGFNQVTSQTKDFTEQVKIENEIKNLEKAAQANYEELGRAMYNASRHSSGEAADYEVIMRQIDGILQQIQEKKAAKQEIMNRVICPSCGKSIPAGTKFCSYCGAPMEQTPVAAAEPAEPQMGGERHCPNCGEVIEPGAKFCVKCGTRIDAGEQKLAETGDSGSSEIGDSAEKEEDSEGIGGSAGAEAEEISN